MNFALWFGLALVVFIVGLVAYARWPRTALPEGTQADHVLVHKAARKLVLLKGTTVLREYRVALGFEPYGAKQVEGDGKTPEGRYTLDYRNPRSLYHRSLHISYPTPEQVARAREKGVSPGGEIMIHGLRRDADFFGRFHWMLDWTHGCIAMSNEEIDEIWRAVPDGTPIEIRP